MNSNIIKELETAAAEARAEALEGPAFRRALEEGDLPVESYVGLLRALTAVCAVLERGKAERDGKLSFLHKDLFFFRYRLLPDIPAAAEVPRAVTADIRVRLKDTPRALYGYRFALHAVLRDLAPAVRAAAENWGVGAFTGGLSLFSEGLGGTDGSGADGEIEALTPADREAVVKAAEDAYGFIASLLKALYPADSKEAEYSSYTLNPAGGLYPVCQSRKELLAVLHAADRALAENPYYLYRYGMSGVFFSDSDGGWLAALPRKGLPFMKDQVRWLAGVLSARGIPSFLMARHLRILYEELTRDVPEKSGQWELLKCTADWLTPKVTAALHGPRRSRGFGEDFAAEEAGTIIARALQDEQRGFSGAAESVISWYTDADRFPEGWIRSVQQFICRLEED